MKHGWRSTDCVEGADAWCSRCDMGYKGLKSQLGRRGVLKDAPLAARSGRKASFRTRRRGGTLVPCKTRTAHINRVAPTPKGSYTSLPSPRYYSSDADQLS